MLLQQQTDAFGQQQSGINKRARAERFKLLRCHRKNFREDAVNVIVIGINSKGLHPARDHFGDVLVQQVQSADAYRH